jgi:glyoxylase-like metal-dependent hydrolase (beta-lactamase superfamily II)
VTPFGGVAGAPFDVVRVLDLPRWREVALWFPAERVLVCADAVGSASYFRSKGEPVGVHPLLRFWPPKALARFEPRQLLLGHGEGLAGDEAAPALRAAIHTARRRIPSWLAQLPQSRRRHQ